MSLAQHFVTVIVDHPPKPSQLYRLGWNAYCSGDSLDSLVTQDEKRGWLAANRSEAETATRGYADRMQW